MGVLIELENDEQHSDLISILSVEVETEYDNYSQARSDEQRAEDLVRYTKAWVLLDIVSHECEVLSMYPDPKTLA